MAITDLSAGLGPTQPEVPNAPDLAGGDLAALQSPEAVDRKLTRVRSVMSVWSAPQLDDRVQLDLATHSAFPDENALGSFLGFANQLEEEGSPNPEHYANLFEPGEVEPGAEPLFDDIDSPISRTRKIVGDITQTGPLLGPQIVSDQALLNFRTDAIARGYLPLDTLADDGRWTPADNTAFFEKRGDDIHQVLAGDGKTIAMSVPEAI